MRRCVRYNCCNGSAERCLTIRPLDPILHPEIPLLSAPVCFVFQHLKRFRADNISPVTTTCRRLSHVGSALRRRISFFVTGIQKLVSCDYDEQKLTRASISVVLFLRGC
ncbi:hypothetical protein AVEN_23819-1 [Araneus ventricosus]|uniref:Uncharacterized protein n=1 Tax=Araneus ventricosus TaxID=182803 RepID=A0A4Y2WA48_ARAVE|nr:hypothetical protein AVEN_23819-1 [Araneus ventricosus]